MVRQKFELDRILKADSLVIYGAGTMGRSVYRCLSESPFMLHPECFIVKSMDDNESSVSGLPVYDIVHTTEYRKSLVLMALHEKIMSEAIDDLSAAGFGNILPISFESDLWADISSRWIFDHDVIQESVSGFHVYRDIALDMNLYVMHSIYDKHLRSVPEDNRYEIHMQVGAALTDVRMSEVTDATGKDHISSKNRKYCELTGIYWAWKNDRSDYIGFSHYRRRFELKEDNSSMMRCLPDIVVTNPVLNLATVGVQFAKDHHASDWEVMMEAIRTLSPGYYDAALSVQNGIYYYAYNMFIMRREILDEYCRFIFPILEYCEIRIGKREDAYQNRYIGFLAERLLTIFIRNNKQYKLAIAEKTFLT